MLPYVSTYGRAHTDGAPTVILIHGAGMDHTVWALQGRHFAFHGWNALAVDLPGPRAVAELPPLGSIEAMADCLAELIGRGGARTLVGHSMGALAALATAARHPATSLRSVSLARPCGCRSIPSCWRWPPPTILRRSS